MKFLDKYNRNARYYPVLLALLPVGIVVASFFPDSFSGSKILSGLLTSGGLTLFLAHLGRDRGKKMEPLLYEKWGGKPTTLTLNPNTTTLNKAALKRIHAKLGQLLGHPLPSEEEAASSPTEADAQYDSATAYLREQTRNTKHFPLVYEELISYGFRRNTLGLKPLGILTSSLGALAIIIHDLPPTKAEINLAWATSLPAISFFSFSLCLLLLISWIFIIREPWVKTVCNHPLK